MSRSKKSAITEAAQKTNYLASRCQIIVAHAHNDHNHAIRVQVADEIKQ